MNPADPESAQHIVAEYAELVERHEHEQAFPAPSRTLPYPKQTIKTAIVTCAATLRRQRALTSDLNLWFEGLYTLLADYLDDELARVLAEYRTASAALAATGAGHAKTHAPEWERVAATSRLAGGIAQTIAADAAALRAEFRDATADFQRSTP